MKTILKVPFDSGIVEKDRRGAAKAPDEIERLAKEQIRDVEWKEVKVTSDFEATQDAITKAALEGYEKGIVIGIGGDHSVSYGLVKAFLKKYPNGGLIVFDAHFDCMKDFHPPTHESWLRTFVEREKFNKVFVVGPRNVEDVEKKFAAKNFAWGLTELYNHPKGVEILKKHIEEFIEEHSLKELYISIDIDVFDPEFAPGTGHPEKSGFSLEQLLPIFRELAKSRKVRGFDIVEVCPRLDLNQVTSRVAAKILIGFL